MHVRVRPVSERKSVKPILSVYGDSDLCARVVVWDKLDRETEVGENGEKRTDFLGCREREFEVVNTRGSVLVGDETKTPARGPNPVMRAAAPRAEAAMRTSEAQRMDASKGAPQHDASQMQESRVLHFNNPDSLLGV